MRATQSTVLKDFKVFAETGEMSEAKAALKQSAWHYAGGRPSPPGTGESCHTLEVDPISRIGQRAGAAAS